MANQTEEPKEPKQKLPEVEEWWWREVGKSEVATTTQKDEDEMNLATPPVLHVNNEVGFWDMAEQPQSKRINDVIFAPFRERIEKHHESGFLILVLLRGLPGSGKTTLGNNIVGGGVRYSTDDYFTQDGNYRFNHTKLDQAHSWNQKRVREALEEKRSPVIVDNTNIRVWEMYAYVRTAVDNGYIIEIMEPCTSWAKCPRVLAVKNSHGVAKNKIKIMLENFDEARVEQMLKDLKIMNYQPTVFQKEINIDMSLDACDEDIRVWNHKIKSSVDEGRLLVVFIRGVPGIGKTFYTRQLLGSGRSINACGTTLKYSIRNKANPIFIDDCCLKLADMIPLAHIASKHNYSIEIIEPKTPWRTLSKYLAERSSQKLSAIAIQEMLIEYEEVSVYVLCTACLGVNDDDDEVTENSEADNSGEILVFPESVWDEDVTEKEVVVATNNVWDDPDEIFELASATPLPPRNRESGSECNTPQKTPKSKIAASFVTPMNIPSVIETKLVNGDLAEISPSSTDTEFEIVLDKELDFDLNNLTITDPQPSTSQHASTTAVAESTRKTPSEILKTLTQLFPNISSSTLNDTYTKCQCDINQTVDALCDSGLQVNSTVTNNIVKTMAQVGPKVEIIESDDDVSDDELFYLDPKPDKGGDTGNEDSMKLTLSPDFIASLMNKYGHPQDAYQTGKDGVSITIPPEISFQLWWLLQEEITAKQNEMVQQVQMEADRLTTCSDGSSSSGISPTPDVREMVALEANSAPPAALETLHTRFRETEPLAAKVARPILYELFPNIEKEIINDIFAANEYSRDKTIECISTTFCDDLPEQRPQAVFSPEYLYEMEKKIIAKALKDSLQDFSHLNTALDETTGGDLRTQARLHAQLAGDYMAQCQAATSSGMRSTALYCAEMMCKHNKINKTANDQACKEIFDKHNDGKDVNLLDLHELLVSEAVKAVADFLEERKHYLRSSGTCNTLVLQIVTGRGAHSRNGQPKIKPAVQRYLASERYKYREVNDGLLEIILRRK